LVSAITNVQLDHQNILGDTIEEIAGEKAGIIKSIFLLFPETKMKL
jgi:dihydrofolate synthase/folylpolyglutamate synthase